MQELLYKIALTRIPKVGAVTARTLVSYCGGAREVFTARPRDLRRIPGIGEAIADYIRRPQVLLEAEAELDWLSRHPHVQPLFYLDEGYPYRLKPYANSPVMLYWSGSADLNTARTLAIIGTRQPSRTGLQATEEIVAGLLPYQPLILSGLAYGIDVTAHRKALEVGLPTVGVLGHGLRKLYPAVHRPVAQRMLAQGGLLTEYPSWTEPEREHFPMRNRIVAALADAVLVVETAKRGGSIITAQFANEYHKEVLAVPGRYREKGSEGCNWLIKTHQAALAESAEDIAYVTGWQAADNQQVVVQPELFTDLNENEAAVVAALREKDRVQVDELLLECRIRAEELPAVLLELECRGLIRGLPGQAYALKGSH